MKNTILLVLVILLSSCIEQNGVRKGLLSEDVLKELNNNNIKYLKSQTPNNMPSIGEYNRLVTVDSNINVFIHELDNNQIDMKIISSFANNINHEMRLFDDSIPYYSSFESFQNTDKNEIKQALIELEYLYGNYLIRFYQSYSFSMPFARVITNCNEDTISIGNTYQAQFVLYTYNPLADYYIEIDNNRIDYPISGDIPTYKFKTNKRGLIKKHGKFYSYHAKYQKYSPLEFEFEFYVK